MESQRGEIHVGIPIPTQEAPPLHRCTGWKQPQSRTWEALGVAQDGDGDEQGGSSSPQEADPPRPDPQRVLGGDVNPARSQRDTGDREREALVGDGAGQLRVPLPEAGMARG